MGMERKWMYDPWTFRKISTMAGSGGLTMTIDLFQPPLQSIDSSGMNKRDHLPVYTLQEYIPVILHSKPRIAMGAARATTEEGNAKGIGKVRCMDLESKARKSAWESVESKSRPLPFR
jgi:hypothetical protein